MKAVKLVRNKEGGAEVAGCCLIKGIGLGLYAEEAQKLHGRLSTDRDAACGVEEEAKLHGRMTYVSDLTPERAEFLKTLENTPRGAKFRSGSTKPMSR